MDEEDKTERVQNLIEQQETIDGLEDDIKKIIKSDTPNKKVYFFYDFKHEDVDIKKRIHFIGYILTKDSEHYNPFTLYREINSNVPQSLDPSGGYFYLHDEDRKRKVIEFLHNAKDKLTNAKTNNIFNVEWYYKGANDKLRTSQFYASDMYEVFERFYENIDRNEVSVEKIYIVPKS